MSGGPVAGAILWSPRCQFECLFNCKIFIFVALHMFCVLYFKLYTPFVLDLEARWVWKRFLNFQAHKLLHALGDVARAARSYCNALFLPPTVCMNACTCSMGLHAILSSQSTQPTSRHAEALCTQASRVCRICGSSAETESFFTTTCRWLKQN